MTYMTNMTKLINITLALYGWLQSTGVQFWSRHGLLSNVKTPIQQYMQPTLQPSTACITPSIQEDC